MKRILLALVGLLLAVSPMMAQRAIATATGKVVKTVEDLKPGYYLVDCYIPYTSGDAKQKPSGSLYYEVGNASNRPFRVHNGFITGGMTEGTVIGKDKVKYLWQVEAGASNSSATYKIKHVSTNTYLPKDDAKNNNMNNPSNKTAAELTPEYKDYTDSHGNHFTGLVLTISSQGWSIFTNHAPNMDPNLSYWDRGDGEVLFQFYEVNPVSTDLDVQFDVSPQPTSEGFATDTKWQLLTISNKYLYYTNDNTNIKVADGYGYEDKYWWTFTKEDNGKLTIYNKAAGASKVLAAGYMTGDKGGSTFPRFVDKNNIPEKQESKWTALPSTSIDQKDGFYLYLGDTVANKMNLRGDLSFWTGGQDQGSTFWVTAIPVITQSIKDSEKTASEAKYVGTIQDKNNQEYKNFLTELNKQTPEGIREAFKVYTDEGKKSVDVSGKHFYLRTPGRNTNTYMHIKDDAALNGINHAANNASIIWKFNGNETAGYTLSSQGNYVTKQTKQSQPVSSSSEQAQACNYKLTKIENKIALWGIAPIETGGYGLHLNGSSNIVGWTNGGASEWYLIPATSMEVTISAAGYTTVNYPFAVQLPENENIKAFIGNIAQSNGQDVFVLRELRDKKIPANTPMILAGDAKTYSLTILDESVQTTAIEKNPLCGTLLSETMPNGQDTYVLSLPQGYEVGFYKLEDTGDVQENATPNRLIPGNKAYLPGSSVPQATAQTYGFAFSLDEDEGGTTGIEETVTDLSNEEFYDLQGRRVMNPSKGIFVTKSGKKVLFF